MWRERSCRCTMCLVSPMLNERAERIARLVEGGGDPTSLREEIRRELADLQHLERTRLKHEKVVAMSEEDAVRYRVISELASNWVYASRVDEGGLSTEWVSEGFERVLGYSPADLETLGGFLAIVTAEDAPLVAKALRTLHAGEPLIAEYRVLAKGGEVVWLRDYVRPEFDGEGRLIRVFGASQVITKEKHAQEALHDALTQLERRVGTEVARFRAILDEASDLIFVVDPRTTSILDVNATACEQLNYTREELLRENLANLLVDAKDWAPESVDNGALKDAARLECMHRRKDGSAFPVELTATTRRFIAKDYLLVVSRGIGERKRMEAQLAQSERLASVGILAAGVAHEINNPLAYILNNISYVASRLTPEQAELRGALREAQSGAERVRDIVKDLKTFSRSEEREKVPVDVTRVLDSAIKVAYNEIRHRAKLERRYQGAPIVHANARLGQVFLNLLLNAAHAIPEGRAEENQITVTVDVEYSEELGELARVSVQDTGSGISKNKLSRIFDPFYTTKPVGMGTGLGLSICRNITDEFGGRIDVKSKVGEGSTFTVVLPTVEEPPPMSRRVSSRPPATKNGGTSVLVVDDDLYVARSVKRLLRFAHEVTICVSPREALDLMRQTEFDVVFCDVMMPEMTGIELHAAVTAFNPDLASRFVFITGGAFTPDAQSSVDSVSNQCIHKPFTLADLVGAMESMALARDLKQRSG